MKNTQKAIVQICDSIKEMLLEKNKKYGDSAIDPVRIFSKTDSTEQIRVRIDDKLSRISRGVDLLSEDEDVINDLIGYLILLKISHNKKEIWDGSDLQPDNSWLRNYRYTCINPNTEMTPIHDG